MPLERTTFATYSITHIDSVYKKKKDKSYYFQILLEQIQYLVKAINDETIKRHITEYILGSDYDYDINADYESFLFSC